MPQYALNGCCFRLQRYKFLKAIHNNMFANACVLLVVSDYKDTNFWKQFTTRLANVSRDLALFQTTKIQIFESNSQLQKSCGLCRRSCFRLQRYKFLKAIHNTTRLRFVEMRVVSDYKDTNFWKQFTTGVRRSNRTDKLFQTTKIQIFESNSQQPTFVYPYLVGLFQTTKIQIFESNSQPDDPKVIASSGCFRLQRYKFLKAIHNTQILHYLPSTVVSDYKDTNFWKQFTTAWSLCSCDITLFQTTKIQIFESNSQLAGLRLRPWLRCFRLQRYKFLKAIHNRAVISVLSVTVVSDYKDTNFWKQFTTPPSTSPWNIRLFQTTKIQIFESNSQPGRYWLRGTVGCFRLQRYKFLKAIHNL